GARADRDVLVRLGLALQAAGGMGRAGAALDADAEGADPLGDRRDRRRRNDLAAGAVRRPPQLGLSLLLAARCDVRALRPGRARISRRGPDLARVAAARRGR